MLALIINLFFAGLGLFALAVAIGFGPVGILLAAYVLRPFADVLAEVLAHGLAALTRRLAALAAYLDALARELENPSSS